jgi:hypothetical protein
MVFRLAGAFACGSLIETALISKTSEVDRLPGGSACATLIAINTSQAGTAMDAELRPLTLGEILDRTFHLYRVRFLLFTGIATVAAAIKLAWQALQTVAIQMLLAKHLAPVLRASLTSFSGLVSAGVTAVALALTLAAITRAVSAIYLGEPTGIAQAYSQVRGRWFRYFRLNLTVFLIACFPILLALLVVTLSVGMAAKAKILTGANMIVAAYGATGFVMIMAVPLAIWLTLRYSLANAACVFEDIGVNHALKRSVLLSKGLRGRIFLMLVMVLAAESALGVLFLVPTYFLLHRTPGHVPIGVTIYSLLVGFVISSLTMPIYGIGLTLFYYDARIRKEGFDVEWRLERTIPADGLPWAPTGNSGQLSIGMNTVGKSGSDELTAE